MAFSRKDLLAVASLARLNLGCGLSEAEVEAKLGKLTEQMAATLDYVKILAQADTEGVEPLFSPLWTTPGYLPPPREDVAVLHESAEAVLSNAPERHDTFFVVPPVL